MELKIAMWWVRPMQRGHLPETKSTMKYSHLILTTAMIQFNASAQTVAPPTVVVEESVTEVTPAIVGEAVIVTPEAGLEVGVAQRRLDAALARQRLGIAPVPIPEREGEVVEKTTTTTTVETPGLPPRIYSTERNVVLVEGRELPYLTIPVLFVEGTADLLDAESLLTIEDTAVAINGVLTTNPTAVFDVEGHTSTDGSDEMNMQLSADRSRRIYTELIQKYGVPTSALAAHGYGENYPKYPDGTEEQMVLDRRVLVVRVK